MIQPFTRLTVADNTGAKKIMCIKVLGGTRARTANIGRIIIASVKEALPQGSVKKGEVVRALIVRSKFGIRRKNGCTLRFSDNAAIILDKQNQMRGTRVFGPVTRELKDLGYAKIVSLAPEIL